MKFKRKKDIKLFSTLHPALIMIFADLCNYAKGTHKIDLVVTQTVSNSVIDKALKRTSPSHRERRAIDIRTKDLDVFIVHDLVRYINHRAAYDKYKYVSRKGIRRLAYYHVGTAEHIHLAIHAKYALKD